MAQAGNSKAGSLTPGRRKRTQQSQQFFEPGKVGRKTGITLKDTGIRDANGLEPVSGIFSSPPSSAQRDVDATQTSSTMLLQESRWNARDRK